MEDTVKAELCLHLILVHVFDGLEKAGLGTLFRRVTDTGLLDGLGLGVGVLNPFKLLDFGEEHSGELPANRFLEPLGLISSSFAVGSLLDVFGSGTFLNEL